MLLPTLYVHILHVLALFQKLVEHPVVCQNQIDVVSRPPYVS